MVQRKWQEDALCLWHRMAVGASRTSGPSDRCSRSQACQWLRVHGGAVARSGGPECGSCASRSSVGAPLPAPAAESRPAVWRLRIDRGPFSVGGCRGERPAARIAEGTGPRGSATAVHQTGAVHALNLVGSRPRPIHVTGTQTRGPCSVLTGNWASFLSHVRTSRRKIWHLPQRPALLRWHPNESDARRSIACGARGEAAAEAADMVSSWAVVILQMQTR